MSSSISSSLTSDESHQLPCAARVPPSSQGALIDRFAAVRKQSLALCESLEIEDYGVQPMADASPPKWHLAHTTWFFETFLLKALLPDYQPIHPKFEYLFNSYYNGVGRAFARTQRGNLSRPLVAEVLDYRLQVEAAVHKLAEAEQTPQLQHIVELGIHHEQQHQELMITDIKYNFGNNPLAPAFISPKQFPSTQVSALTFSKHTAGIVTVGVAEGFAFDNERPRHQVLLQPFAMADRLITNAEYLEFIQDGGYRRSDLWLSEGWAWVQANQAQYPLYWRLSTGSTEQSTTLQDWQEYRLDGLAPLQPMLPVVHVNAYEASAFAAWKGLRLPTEFEWEFVASQQPHLSGSFLESGRFHPRQDLTQKQFFGEVWQWTSSAYGPYPGFQPLPGTLGEYNGKFMSSQLVLRGGSCATPRSHIRPSYRNFFYPGDQWQFSGIRLAKDERSPDMSDTSAQ